jgi:hypothetical protein
LILKAAYFTYALGTQLTTAGQQALLCLTGGAVKTLYLLVNPTNAALAAGIAISTVVGIAITVTNGDLSEPVYATHAIFWMRP